MTVTTRKVGESPNHLMLHVFMESDGAELDDDVLLSPLELVPVRSADAPAFRIMQVWYSMIGFDVVFKFGGIAPRPVWTLARDGCNHVDFRSFGGLRDTDTVPPSDRSGELLISTNGFSILGSQGSMVIELRKLSP